MCEQSRKTGLLGYMIYISFLGLPVLWLLCSGLGEVSSSEDISQIRLLFLRCPTFTKQLSGIWRMEVIGIMLASEHSVYLPGFQRTVKAA